MPTRYHLYSGDHAGGPIDYSVPIGDVFGTVFDTPALPKPSRTWFGLRAWDDQTGMEEQNRDVTVFVALDAAGNDVSREPAAPLALTATPRGADGIEIRWRYMAQPNKPEPDHYQVWATPGVTVDYAQPAVALPLYMPGRLDYVSPLTGLLAGQLYAVGVRAALGPAVEQNTMQVQATVKGAPPKNPVDLTALVTFRE